jgi:hypothetical protein
MQTKKNDEQEVVFVEPEVRGRAKKQTPILLKAMDLAKDPEKMRQMMGVKTVAEVYKTLDKLSLRKAYHEALSQFDIDFNYIVKNLKDLGDTGNDKIRLGVMQTLLKSLGTDKYDLTDTGAGGDWEEVLLKKIEEEKEARPMLTEGLGDKDEIDEIDDFEVFTPQAPKDVLAIKDKEKKIGEDLYGKNLYE